MHRTGNLLYIIAVTDIFVDFLTVQGYLRGEHIRFVFHPALLHIEDIELFEAACSHSFLSVQNIVSDLVEHNDAFHHRMQIVFNEDKSVTHKSLIGSTLPFEIHGGDFDAKLTEEIKGLQPEKELTSNEDYSVKLLELRERLKEYPGFDYSVIPESIVEAFIERIWVSKDEFRWYLRTGNKAEGEFDPDDHIKIGSFTLTIDDAKKYIYSFSTHRRVYKWVDLNVSVWI